LLFVFNASQGSAAVNRELGFHPPGLHELTAAARTAYYWIIPLRAPTWLEATVFAASGLAVVALAVSLRRSWRSGAHVTPAATRVRVMLALVTLCYAALLFTALTLYDAQSIPDSRLMLPMVPPLAILVVALLGDAMRVPQRRVPAIALSAALASGAVASATNWVVITRTHGLGYNAPAWRESALMAAIRGMGPETIVYTNHPGAILFQTGREVPGIPRLANPNSLEPNASWAAQMAAICERAAHRRVVYAHFTVDSREWFLPSLHDVRRRLHSRPGLVAREGVMEVVPASCAADRANAGE
jgi:hypothetical protein